MISKSPFVKRLYSAFNASVTGYQDEGYIRVNLLYGLQYFKATDIR